MLTRAGAEFFDAAGARVERPIKRTALTGAAVGKGNFRHFMEKELHEHPAVLGDTLRRMINPATRAVALPDLPFDLARRLAHHHERLRLGLLRRAGRAYVVGDAGAGFRPMPMWRASSATAPRRCRKAGSGCW